MRIVIIGGGIMGLSIAFELKQVTPALEVMVLERSIPGAEASTAAAGMLAPQFENNSPGPLFELCLLSRMAWPKFAAQLEDKSNIDVGYVPSGALQVAFTDDELHALDAKVSWQQACGLRATLLGADALTHREPRVSALAVGAAEFEDDHQVDPRKLMAALSIAAARVGVKFQTGTVRTLLERSGTIVGVDVEGERIDADLVILAAGAWSAQVAGSGVDPARVKPARGQMLEFQVRAPIVARMLKSAQGYVVPRLDGRVTVGSTVELVGFDKKLTGEGLSQVLSAALQLLPDLASAEVVKMWAGLRPWTDHQLPFLGEGFRPGLVLATGHFRNGILLAPITARLIGQLVRREKTSVDLKPFRYGRDST